MSGKPYPLVSSVFDVLLAGAGRASVSFMSKGAPYLREKAVGIVGNGLNWSNHVGPHQLLGQSRRGLTQFPDQDLYNENARMPASEHTRESQQRLADAIFRADPKVFTSFDTMVTKVTRLAGTGLKVQCADGATLFTKQIIFGGGLGPERSLEDSGVLILNTISPRRAVHREVDTAYNSMGRSIHSFKGRRIVVYGGGATAAWRMSDLLGYGLDATWLASRGFQGASPNGVNNHILRQAEDRMVTGRIDTLRYLGDPGSAPTEGMELTLIRPGDKTTKVRADVVIAATGSDALAPTGVFAIFGEEYSNLKLGNGSKGVLCVLCRLVDNHYRGGRD